MHLKQNIYLALASLTLSSIGFSQGVYWESSISGGMAGRERTDRYYYMPRMLKVANSGDGSASIVRLDREKMMMVDSKQKTYWEVTFAEMEQFMRGASAEMDAQMQEMEKQLAQLPEEERKMAEQMMGPRMKKNDQKVEVSKTGETKTISGYACSKYVVKMGGEQSATVWATHDLKQFEVMQKDMEEFANRMQAIMPPQAKDASGLMGGIDGFPIQTETQSGWKSTVTKVEARSTAANEFEVPADYTKVDPPMKRGGMKEE